MSPNITVAVPVLDERGTLEELHQRVTEVLREMGASYEILFVDDGSVDGSRDVLRTLADADPAVGVVRFRRNFGKSAALHAAFRRARGEIVITMDADLQDDPSEIPRLLAKLEEDDLDLVSGWKKKRHDPLGKTLPSKVFNFVVRRLTGLHLNDFNCGFKAYRGEVVKELDLYGELHRYIPVLADGMGFTCGEVPVQHHARKWGRSKYGVERMAKGFFDLLTVILLTRYRRRPLHLFGWGGLLSFTAGFLCLAYLTFMKLAFDQAIAGRPLFFLGVLLVLLGMQLVSTGLLGEMINGARSERPGYHVAEERPVRDVARQSETTTEKRVSA